MARTVAIGEQDFARLREQDSFYIDKSDFIREWWERRDAVTLITRPRRFGKTLNLRMMECFFSDQYADRGDLFEGLRIWKTEQYRSLQGTYPVLFLSFAGVKQGNFDQSRKMINELITGLYSQYAWLVEEDWFTKKDRDYYDQVSGQMEDATAALSLNRLCRWLEQACKKKCIVLLDEYDTPLQEAYINGYWDEMTAYVRALFNNTFKTNPALERGLLTGITRVSRESIFSDLNNLFVVTTTSNEYTGCFGFTQEEVLAALEEQGFGKPEQEKVKQWYDGFRFGRQKDIYNPWSVTMFLSKRELGAYWSNTSSNRLAGQLLASGSPEMKMAFEQLLHGESIEVSLDEQVVFEELENSTDAVWSLLLASGYLKVDDVCSEDAADQSCRISLTNLEVRRLFEHLIQGWFRQTNAMSPFVKAMFSGNVKEMNAYMNRMALNTFSYFDSGRKPSGKEPERFYHGFVLGLLVENAGDYMVRSNRESGFGRYDVVLEPRDIRNSAAILEFKVRDAQEGEKSLEDTARSALRQIEEKPYEADLIKRGIPGERILKYGFAFEGEHCLIREQSGKPWDRVRD